MNVGLLYTPVSIFQMTRGALVLFVGILSVLFLHRRLHLYQWFALLVVMGGIAVVGLSGSLVKTALSETDPTQRAFEDGPPPETSVLIGASFHFFFPSFLSFRRTLRFFGSPRSPHTHMTFSFLPLRFCEALPEAEVMRGMITRRPPRRRPAPTTRVGVSLLGDQPERSICPIAPARVRFPLFS